MSRGDYDEGAGGDFAGFTVLFSLYDYRVT